LSRSLGIGEADWAFKVSFEASDWELSAPNVDLVFDGLDTFSVISLVRKTLIGTGIPEPQRGGAMLVREN